MLMLQALMAPNRVEMMMWMRTVTQRSGTYPVAIWMVAVENNENANAQLEDPMTCCKKYGKRGDGEQGRCG